MPYPESCYTGLVGIRGVCTPASDVTYWLDDVPGVDLDKLARLANSDANTGASFGAKLIESSARLMIADVEAIYDGGYKIENMLVNGCSTCTLLSNYGAGTALGVLIKDNTSSSFSQLVIDKLSVKIGATGLYTVVIDDGVQLRMIQEDFVTGEIVEFRGINFRTKKKEVRIYLQEPDVPLAQLSCPRKGSGCGCTGKAAVLQDLIYTGTNNGAEQQQAYGFIPCAFITCSAEDLLCFLSKSAPRMIGMALLFKVAEQFFRENQLTERNNRVSFKEEEKVDEAKRYAKLYLDRLNGVGVRGVKDLVRTSLKNLNDTCVVCNANLVTTWAAT